MRKSRESRQCPNRAGEVGRQAAAQALVAGCLPILGACRTHPLPEEQPSPSGQRGAAVSQHAATPPRSSGQEMKAAASAGGTEVHRLQLPALEFGQSPAPPGSTAGPDADGCCSGAVGSSTALEVLGASWFMPKPCLGWMENFCTRGKFSLICMWMVHWEAWS